jgi:hypothetical protein
LRAHVRPRSTSSPVPPEGGTRSEKESEPDRENPNPDVALHPQFLLVACPKKTHSLALLYFPLFRCKGTWRLPIAYAMERPRFAARPICVRDRTQTNSSQTVFRLADLAICTARSVTFASSASSPQRLDSIHYPCAAVKSDLP